jgi:predicted metalloprotease with PDZ domain
MDKFGGLEHDHSTVMMSSPWQMRGRKDYIKWLGLVSHEFFHSWNVRRMRPEALVDYDYSGEMYTRELWLAEGLTSYYDNLLLFRAGLIDVGDYFELLAEEFRKYETSPGRAVRSAELASFDTWIKHYKEDSNKLNSTISYYVKGGLIGFVTDMEIRRATDNRKSLDTVMRSMYSQYGPRESGLAGYPPGAFEQQVEEVAGPAVRKAVEDMLQTTVDPHIDEALGFYGLSLRRDPLNGNGTNEAAGIGVNWQETGASLFAEYVVRGQPAAEAGVLPGDELLAINGFRVVPENYVARFLKLERGETVQLTLVRDGRLLTLSMVTGPELASSYAIVPESRINKREKERMESWLGRPLQFK